MRKYYYLKKETSPLKKWVAVFGLAISLVGIAMIVYILSPLILWQIYFENVFASEDIALPIPKSEIVNPATITNIADWFPNFKPEESKKLAVSSYNISIPKINIENASVSTIDTDLEKHLVNYPNASIPGDPGNAVIFGHSTLPQFYNPKNYKTIFANIFKLEIGDKIFVSSENETYQYKVYNISVVDSSDTSSFSQTYDNSYLTLVTCTPPGTTWKRLIVKAKLENKSDYAKF